MDDLHRQWYAPLGLLEGRRAVGRGERRLLHMREGERLVLLLLLLLLRHCLLLLLLLLLGLRRVWVNPLATAAAAAAAAAATARGWVWLGVAGCASLR